jgi:hypothetical protein
MRAAFTLQVTPVLPQVAKEIAPLHPTTTFSRVAVAGMPRRPSLRLSSRMRLMAALKLFRAAAFVRP